MSADGFEGAVLLFQCTGAQRSSTGTDRARCRAAGCLSWTRGCLRARSVAGASEPGCDKSHSVRDTTASECPRSNPFGVPHSIRLHSLTLPPGRGSRRWRSGDRMDDTSVYFGVQCPYCGERLPLVEVISAPHVISWRIPEVKPFRAECTKCALACEYHFEDLFVFPGPPPRADFDVHPVFRRINF